MFFILVSLTANINSIPLAIHLFLLTIDYSSHSFCIPSLSPSPRIENRCRLAYSCALWRPGNPDNELSLKAHTR